MSTIVVSPQETDEESETELVDLSIVVTNLEELLEQFDRITVWRSKDTADGPYSELTAESWLSPRIPESAGDKPAAPVTGAQAYLVGKELELLINERDGIPVVFTGTDPLTFAEAAGQIVTQSSGRLDAYVDEDGLLVIEGVQPGTSSSLRVVGGDAAAILGLPLEEPDSVSYGRDPRIPLVAGQTTYSFIDGFGSSSYFYETQYQNHATGAVSQFSQSFSVDSVTTLSPTSLIIGSVDVVDAMGRPQRNVEVRVYTVFDGALLNGHVVAGRSLMKLTDAQGHAEFQLIRGQKASVAIIGTDIVRDILVPTDAALSSFSLLGPEAATGDDVFKVAVPVVIGAERRTL